MTLNELFLLFKISSYFASFLNNLIQQTHNCVLYRTKYIIYLNILVETLGIKIVLDAKHWELDLFLSKVYGLKSHRYQTLGTKIVFLSNLKLEIGTNRERTNYPGGNWTF